MPPPARYLEIDPISHLHQQLFYLVKQILIFYDYFCIGFVITFISRYLSILFVSSGHEKSLGLQHLHKRST